MSETMAPISILPRMPPPLLLRGGGGQQIREVEVDAMLLGGNLRGEVVVELQEEVAGRVLAVFD